MKATGILFDGEKNVKVVAQGKLFTEKEIATILGCRPNDLGYWQERPVMRIDGVNAKTLTVRIDGLSENLRNEG